MLSSTNSLCPNFDKLDIMTAFFLEHSFYNVSRGEGGGAPYPISILLNVSLELAQSIYNILAGRGISTL
jgi:hypothetical protein